MRALVTGAAGFIGSHLVESLLYDGHTVVGIDSFSDYYARDVKEANLRQAATFDTFEFVNEDIVDAPLESLLADADAVFHLAAQAGVRRSWAEFSTYVHDNVMATQRLLEATRAARSVKRFVFASSSSVYGDSESFPTFESDRMRPRSPYGVTKLAGEELCGAYGSAWGVPTVSLRFFTVYGPRQRPDMAFHRMCRSAIDQTPFSLYGDGSAVRSFTFVADVVRAVRLAGEADLPPGEVLNIAGVEEHSVNEAIALIRDVVGSPVRVEYRAVAKGDVARTGGDISRARELLGWQPTTKLVDGLEAQVEWHKSTDAGARRGDARRD